MAMHLKYTPLWYHKKIAAALEALQRGDIQKLIIMAPPQHGKSQLSSIDFPSWCLGKNKDEKIIMGSYASEIAEKFGRTVRNSFADPVFQSIFPGVILSEDSKAVNRFNTNGEGYYIATGRDGSVTSYACDLLILDDMFKGDGEAKSETIREKVWQIYNSVYCTRLHSKSRQVMFMCMTGDTPVLMEDGIEKMLCDIRIGDRVLTYDEGKLSVSTVRNWKSNGRDNIFAITMSSGKIVRANERHPFLTYFNEKLQWTRLKNLTIAHKIVTLKDSGGSGKERYVSSVKSQLSLGGIAPLITTRKNGLMDIVRRRLMQYIGVMSGLNIVMVSIKKNIISFLRSKEANAKYANSHRVKMFEPIGVESSASTIAMKQEKSEDCFATIVTSQSDIQKMNTQQLPWQNTSDFILEDIVSIENNGVEEVFDLQVDRTENFIANGVVSHNTRWHDDDLIGRVLNTEANQWEVLKFPAIAEEDEQFRKKGEALWTDKFPLELLDAVKKKDPTLFYCMYQQNPVNEENAEFKREWFRYFRDDECPGNMRIFTTVDPAISKKASADDSCVMTVGVTPDNVKFVLEYTNAKLNPSELIEEIFRHYDKYNPVQVGIETVAYQEALSHFLKIEMKKRNTFMKIEEIRTHQDKESKIRGLIPHYQNGVVYHRAGFCDTLEQQLLRFPISAHDDVMDALAMQLQLWNAPLHKDGIADKPKIKTREQLIKEEFSFAK